MNQAAYPIQFSVDYPDRPLDRLKTLIRPIAAIPILIVLGAVSGATTLWTSADGTTAAAGAGGALFLGPLLMIVARRKYPRWWFDWNLELQRFGSRVVAYLALMDDRYPSTDDQQSVRLDYAYPDATQRLEPLVAAGEVVPGDPPLRRPGRLEPRGSRRGDRGVGARSWSRARRVTSCLAAV